MNKVFNKFLVISPIIFLATLVSGSFVFAEDVKSTSDPLLLEGAVQTLQSARQESELLQAMLVIEAAKTTDESVLALLRSKLNDRWGTSETRIEETTPIRRQKPRSVDELERDYAKQYLYGTPVPQPEYEVTYEHSVRYTTMPGGQEIKIRITNYLISQNDFNSIGNLLRLAVLEPSGSDQESAAALNAVLALEKLKSAKSLDALIRVARLANNQLRNFQTRFASAKSFLANLKADEITQFLAKDAGDRNEILAQLNQLTALGNKESAQLLARYPIESSVESDAGMPMVTPAPIHTEDRADAGNPVSMADAGIAAIPVESADGGIDAGPNIAAH